MIVGQVLVLQIELTCRSNNFEFMLKFWNLASQIFEKTLLYLLWESQPKIGMKKSKILPLQDLSIIK